jgi:hypothetical protein
MSLLAQQDPGVRGDIHAVYSASLSNLTQGPSADEIFYIQQTTVPVFTTPFRSTPNEVCYPRTPANDMDWNEALAVLRQSTFNAETIGRQLQIKNPYILLDDKGVAEIRGQQREEEVARGRNWNYVGAKRLFQFSNVFFNQKRTLALVQVSIICGGLCGEGTWKVFEKIDGQWRPYNTNGQPPCPPDRIA